MGLLLYEGRQDFESVNASPRAGSGLALEMRKQFAAPDSPSRHQTSPG